MRCFRILTNAVNTTSTVREWKHADEIERARPSRDGDLFHVFSEGHGTGSVFDFGDIPTGDLLEELFSSGDIRGFGRSRVQYDVEVSLEEAFNGAARLMEVPGAGGSDRSRRIEVKIPPGVDTGTRVRVSAENGRRQDIYLEVTVRPHSKYRRTGADLHTEVGVPLEDVVLGGEVAIPTLKGKSHVDHTPGDSKRPVFQAHRSGHAPFG